MGRQDDEMVGSESSMMMRVGYTVIVSYKGLDCQQCTSLGRGGYRTGLTTGVMHKMQPQT
jgi:hypothetical protein